MLVAASRNKLKRKIHLWEDEVTSTIFGSLADMQPVNVWKVVYKMALAAGIEESLLPTFFSPTDCSFEFWPRYQNVEPDVVLHFKATDGTVLHLILEVKWGKNGKISPNCELIRQWLTRPNPAEQWIHIYLVHSETKGKADVLTSITILAKGCDKNGSECSCEKLKFISPPKATNLANSWEKRLGSISWNHMQKIVQQIESNTVSPFFRWAKGVHCFLERCGYVPFIGFNWLTECRFQVLEDNCNTQLFYKAPMFSFLEEDRFAYLEAHSDQLHIYNQDNQENKYEK